jgi:hypothetical protein
LRVSSRAPRHIREATWCGMSGRPASAAFMNAAHQGRRREEVPAWSSRRCSPTPAAPPACDRGRGAAASSRS